MGLSIKNDEVERMARQLAAQRGVSITEAIKQSLEDAIASEVAEKEKRLRRLLAISDRAAAKLKPSSLSDDEILGYDEFGIPTR